MTCTCFLLAGGFANVSPYFAYTYLTNWSLHSPAIKEGKAPPTELYTLLIINNNFYQLGHCPNAIPPENYLFDGWKTHSDCREVRRGI